MEAKSKVVKEAEDHKTPPTAEDDKAIEADIE